jgi:histidine phosphotransfer protein HptB
MPVSEIKNSGSGPALRSTRVRASALLDFDVLKAFEKVNSDDGSDVVIELIDLYLQSSSQRIIAMRNAAHEGEWAVLKREAHTLKGSSSTLGLCQIAKICEDLEDASSRPGDIRTLMILLESKFLEVKPVLIRERNRRRGFAAKVTNELRGDAASGACGVMPNGRF